MGEATKLKPMPHHYTDEEADRFLEEADLSEYDLSGFKPMRFEFAKKEARMEVRLPQHQLDALKRLAKEEGVPHSRIVRRFITEGLMKPRT
jgi:predicted DNA binding CopG/RHH family protein